ncbi:energy transducer TonB [Steroidobacter sp. S1-65]|uniref:Energy transducer TonB n=1 Tax=Steroidobacter gossypii TaxID=2805490 RepID=A0ABS1WQX7_9GAMM|nr:energy transducer TonB [Steroidobacter gossypii]MBM0103376.1 energy transducer TonB [Steroidobacter gossypii]
MTATTINTFPSMHSWNSPRGWALAIIVLLHLGFFWALSSGLTPKLLKVFIPEPPVYLPVPSEPKPPEPVVIKEPVIQQQITPTVVRPVLDFTPEPVTDSTPLLVREPTAPNDFTGSGSVAEPAPEVVEPRIDSRRGLSEPFYPPQVIREGGEGTVLLSIYILADGRVGEVRLDRSSGYAKLDESAMREAKRWRFVPGTSDGKPTAMWKQLPVTFKLNTRM